MIAFIDAHRDQFGVELICRVLRPAVRGFLTSRGYRAAKARPPSTRTVRDQLLVGEVARLHAENYGVYGRRKMHALMRREGWDVGRDQTERLMRLAGVRGAAKSKKTFTTRPDPKVALPEDLVNRRFTAEAPRQLWVCDVTYVATPSWLVWVRLRRLRHRRVLPPDRGLERRGDAAIGGAAVAGARHGRLGCRGSARRAHRPRRPRLELHRAA